MVQRNDDPLAAYCLYPCEDAFREVAHSRMVRYAITTISQDTEAEGYVQKKLYHVPLPEPVDWIENISETIINIEAYINS